MKPHYRYAIFGLLALGILWVSAPAVGGDILPFRTYTVVDGLSQSEVTDVAQDRTGYLWFTTARGLNRFDGRHFEHITIAHGLPTNDLTALAVGADNELWVGDGRGGLSLLRGGRVVRTVQALKGHYSAVMDLAVIGDDVLAVVDELGVVLVDGDGGSTELVLADHDAPRQLIAVDERLWVLNDSGLSEFSLTAGPMPASQLPETRAVFVQGDTLWALRDDNRVGTWSEHGFELRATLAADATIETIAVAQDGTIWAATDTTLISAVPRADGSYADAVTTVHYDGFDQILQMFIDAEHTLWLSSASGLVRSLGDRFEHYALRTGVASQAVWGIAEDGDGRMWFGTQRGLLLSRTDDTFEVVGPDRGVPLVAVRDIVSDSAGILWVGLYRGGLYRVDPALEQGTLIEGTEDTSILDVAVTEDGVVWMATRESGIYRYLSVDQSLRHYPSFDGAAVYSLITAGDGSLWYGAEEKALVHLTLLADGDFRQEAFGAEYGLKRRLFNQIHWVAEDDIWVAMEEGAIYRFDGQRFNDIGIDRPFADQSVYAMELLDDGSVVVGGEQGLYHFVPDAKRTAHYDHLTGFFGHEASIHATFIDSRGHLWIGTIDGVSRMDITKPMSPPIDLTPEIVHMETLAGAENVGDRAEIAASERGVRIEYAAVSLTSPKNLEFSYKLSGLDVGWSAATSNRTVTYSSLPAGDYDFKVRARHPGGDWYEVAAPRRFTMLPYFWQRPLNIGIAVLAILLAIAAVMASRTRSIRRTNEELRLQVAKRTASIQRAKEKLQSSNEMLSLEIEERRKSDQARAEVETRFRRAFEHAPIGMGLLDRDGRLFDANPALGKMLWPTLDEAPTVDFVSTVGKDDRERFSDFFAQSVHDKLEHVEDKFVCVDSTGNRLNTEVNLSAVQSDAGEHLYSVLQVLDVTESLKLTDKLEHQATYDELTGLLNRRAFEAELARAWERGHDPDAKSVLMFMDLDQFKVVNDTSGHAAGDALLKRISEVLVDSVRANDTVGRLGGDEFAIILWKCPLEVAQRIAEGIRVSIEGLRFQWDQETYRVGVSIGGVPVDASVGDIGELQQLADAACYAAKEAGRNCVHMISGTQDTAHLQRGQVRWVQRLRDAMDHNRFAIYGQSIRPIDAELDEPDRYEVLLRLRDPDSRRLIPPGAFLPAAERYGLSLELDEWVVRSLVKALFVYQSFQAEHCRYWINLSGSSIGNERFAAFLKEHMTRSPLPPGTINFEITERAVIRNLDEANRLMSELRNMGCQFALDDFGSGLSSFDYLKQLPVDFVKIDAMLARDILVDETNRTIVKSIIDVAHTLDIQVVCEHIENEEKLELARELGADYVQGFAVGQPFVLAPSFPGASPAEEALRQQAG